MSRVFSLAHLTALSLPPPELVDVGGRAGYDFVGLRLLPATPGGRAYPLMDDAPMLRETLARMKDTGIAVFDLEIVRLDERFDAGKLLPFLDVGRRLGARAMLVAGDDRDEARLAQSFAALCEAARPFGMAADIEFMPWTAVPNLSSAVRLVDGAGRPANAGILVDALHFARSRSHLPEIKALPRSWLHYSQICDAPAGIPPTDAELIHTARSERLLPGEGGIDLRALYDRLPADLPVAVEIPNDVRAPAMGFDEWSRQAIVAARKVLERPPIR
jgi:sugar phosphate isomerase/epimerase